MMIKCFSKKVILWMLLTVLLLSVLSSCRREPLMDSNSSISSVLEEESVVSMEISLSSQPDSSEEKAPSENDSPRQPSSQAPAVSSKEPEAPSVTPSASEPSQETFVESSPEETSVEHSMVSMQALPEESGVLIINETPGIFNTIALTFRPECITNQEEMTSVEFFPELNSDWIHSITWMDNEPGEETLYISFEESLLNQDSRKEIRLALLGRKDLLEIYYLIVPKLSPDIDLIS